MLDSCAHRRMLSYLPLGIALTIATTWAIASGVNSQELRRHMQQVQMFDSLIENMDSACVIVDSKGTVRVWNRKATADLGWTKEEMLDTNIELLIPEEHLQEFRAARQKILAADKKPVGKQRVRGWAITKTGQHLPIDLSVRVVPDGSEVYFLALIDKSQEVQPPILLEKPMEPTPLRSHHQFRQASND